MRVDLRAALAVTLCIVLAVPVLPSLSSSLAQRDAPSVTIPAGSPSVATPTTVATAPAGPDATPSSEVTAQTSTPATPLAVPDQIPAAGGRAAPDFTVAMPAEGNSTGTTLATTVGSALAPIAPTTATGGVLPALGRSAVGGPSVPDSNLVTNYTLRLANGSLLAGNVLTRQNGAEYAAYDPITGMVYLTYDSHNISIVDPARFVVTGHVQLPSWTGAIVYDGRDRLLLVESSGQLFALDARNGTLSYTVAVVDAAPDGTLVLDPVDDTVWVTNPFSANVSVLNLTSRAVVAHAHVGGGFNDILAGVYDPVNGEIYLAYYENDTIEVFNARTFARIASVNLAATACCFAWGLGLDPATGDVFATSGLFGWGSLLVKLRASNNTVAGSVGIGGYPSNSVLDPTTGELYVADSYQSRLTVVNPTNLSVVAHVHFSQDSPLLAGQLFPVDVPALHRIFVPTFYGYSLDAISTAASAQVGVIHGDSAPVVSAFDPACGCVAVADSARDDLYLVRSNLSSVLATVGLAGTPRGIAFDTRTGDLWVTLGGLFGANAVEVLNATTGAPILTIGDSALPWGIAYDPENDRMYVGDYFGNDLRVYNASNGSMIAKIATGNQTSGVVFDSATESVYTANWGTGNLSIVNVTSDTTVGAITVYGAPEALALDPSSGRLLVGDYSGLTVRVVNVSSESVQSTLPVRWASGFAFDPTNGSEFVFNGTSSIFEHNSSSNLSTVLTAGLGTLSGVWVPGAGLLANDPSTGSVYLLPNRPLALSTNVVLRTVPETLAVGGNLSVSIVFQGPAPTAVQYSGLPRGCPTTNATAFSCVPSTPGEYTLRANLSFPDGDQAILTSVVWVQPSYSVAFVETGLPAGTAWAVLTGGGTYLSSTSSTLGVPETNGTQFYRAWAFSGHLVGSPSSGTFTIAGASAEVNVPFVPTYSVTFAASGLPTNLLWTITINTDPVNSTTSTLGFWLVNGTYAYTGFAQGYVTAPGSFTVDGGALTLGAIFHPTTYSLTFHETGLASGTLWNVTLGYPNQLETSVGRNVTFAVANGSYSYWVGAPGNYRAFPSIGGVYILGASAVVSITFTPLYPVKFTALNLPPGTVWSVTVAGDTQASNGTSLTFWESNGSYSYTLQRLTGYQLNSTSGTVTVAGGPVYLTVPYEPTNGMFPVVIQTNLPKGTPWSVTAPNGTTLTTTNGTVVFSEPSGFYRFLYPENVNASGRWYHTGASEVGVGVLDSAPITGIIYTTVLHATLLVHERGGPASQAWGLKVGLSPYFFSVASGSPSLTFAAPEVALPVSFSPPIGYGVARVLWTGVENQSWILVHGPMTVVVVFAPIERLTFFEAGLPLGATWGLTLTPAVSVGGPTPQNLATNGSSLTFSVVRATWRFSVVAKPDTFRARPGHGVVTLPAHAVQRLIKFVPFTEKVVFKELGLPSGTLWGVNLTGPSTGSLNTTGSSLAFYLVNGTYSFVAWNVSALYPHPAYSSFTVTASGTILSIVILYNTTVAPYYAPGLSPVDLGTGPVAGPALAVRT